MARGKKAPPKRSAKAKSKPKPPAKPKARPAAAAPTGKPPRKAPEKAAAPPAPPPEAPAASASSTGARRGLTAEDMAKRQREISVAEFFTKNRHLLGFDNPRKSLLTAVKEAVDNALDACEEAGILPTVWVTIERLKGNGAAPAASAPEAAASAPAVEGPSSAPTVAPAKGLPKAERYRVTIRDNGPGIVGAQIPRIFGKLLYGSKFHRLRQSRGQQGIGISAAAMYGQLTTGQPCRITSRTAAKKKPHYFEIHINTKTNEPEFTEGEKSDWDIEHGTEVSIELEGLHQKGPRSVDAYLEATVIANPHVEIIYKGPDGETTKWPRAAKELPPEAAEIKPHPHGVELGVLMAMLRDTKSRNVAGFLKADFSRVGPGVALEICRAAGIDPTARPSRIAREEADRLHAAIQRTKIMSPPLNCLSPIGEALLLSGLKRMVKADFYTATSRKPSVYRGNPFLIECALAYGGADGAEGAAKSDEPATLYRFANRVPLLYQQGACASFKASVSTNWRSYGLTQPKGALPVAPLTVVVHMASAWVPFTSESKEAMASYPEIMKDMRLALMECGRRLGITIRKGLRLEDALKKADYIKTYIPQVALALQEILGLSDRERDRTVKDLTQVLEKSRQIS